ncbi:Fungal specific transcription factor [Sporothrix epigloea]|uniref:Fungal specific transcription factor n=1 Tax=Sporothrix epigloea TaxID=1892477 RepID=A0ABP0DEE9_9PEZI
MSADSAAKHMRILVINPNSSVSVTKSLEALFCHIAVPNTTAVFWTCPRGPSILQSQADLHESAAICLPLLLDVADGFDGFLAACYADHPLVPLLQSRVGPKPVVGIFEATIAAALHLVPPSFKFGIITTNVAYEAHLTRGVRRLLDGRKDELAKFGSVVATNIGLDDLRPGAGCAVREKILAAVQRLLASGQADIKVIIVGGVILAGVEELVHDACELSPPRKKRVLSTNDDKTQAAVAGPQPYRKASRGTNERPVLRDYASLQGQSLLKKTLGHQNRQSSAVIGATSDFDPSIISSLSWNARGEHMGYIPPQVLRRANSTVHFMMRPDTQDEMDAEIANLDAIESFVAPHGPELVNLYFRIVHPSFPILHKRVFLEKYGRSYRELTPTGLGAVYIAALNWWSYSLALSNMPKPETKGLEAMVLHTLFEVHQRPKISDLQGGLVLMQCPGVSSWALTGYLVAMAQNLGINIDCSDWQVPGWERGVRKRVAWALFMQDTWGALVYGRGCHIQADDWDVRPLDSADFPETAKDDDTEEGSAEIEKGKQTFLHMVSLTEIVADIRARFFTLRALRQEDNLEAVLEMAKPLQLRLKAWHSSLPQTLSVGETVPRKLSSVGYLHLAYYTAEVTLHRAILRSHAVAADLPRDLYTITWLAAGTRFSSALDFVKRLKAEHLQSFWFFSSSLSLAIIGMFASQLCAMDWDGDQAARESYRSKFAEYLWILRINARSADFMNYAVGILDSRSQLLQQQLSPDGRDLLRRQSQSASESQASSVDLTAPSFSVESPFRNSFSFLSSGETSESWGGSDVMDSLNLYQT